MARDKFKVKHKEIFIGLSCIAIGSLFGAFAYPLQQFEVWEQTESSVFNSTYTKTFVLNEVDQNLPYGLEREKAQKIASIYNDAKNQKLILVVIGIMSASAALVIGEDTVENAEIEREITKIDNQAKKEVLINQIKHKWAMASEAQKQLYRQEYRELVELFGEQTQEASEINETDKFTNAFYMIQEGHSIDTVVTQTWNIQPGSEDFDKVKKAFQDWLEKDE